MKPNTHEENRALPRSGRPQGKHHRRHRPQNSTKRKAAAFAAQLAPVIAEIRAAVVQTLKGIARCLNARGINEAARGRIDAAGSGARDAALLTATQGPELFAPLRSAAIHPLLSADDKLIDHLLIHQLFPAAAVKARKLHSAPRTEPRARAATQ